MLSSQAEVDGLGEAVDPGAVGELPVSPVFVHGGVNAIVGYPDGIAHYYFVAEDVAGEGVRSIDDGLASIVLFNCLEPVQGSLVQEFVCTSPVDGLEVQDRREV